MIVFATTAMLSAGAASAQNIPAGKAIAQVWCSNCHRVDPQEKTAAQDAVPTFLSIAQMKSTTEMSLAAFLTRPHGATPNRDVSAYILSLRKRP